ncbi:MAG: hypothetical protein AAFO03_16205 [Bacteroidota bacterium]
MKIVLLVEGGRKAPTALFSQSEQWGVELRPTPVAGTDWKTALEDAYAVMLLVPTWGANAYLSPVTLWQQYLEMEAPSKRLILASFESSFQHANHLDLLRLTDYSAQWWEDCQPIDHMQELPPVVGVDLSEKLQRFFAGHGQDSIVAVLSRIRLVVQMASRELRKMQTPYEEIYSDLVEPAELGQKWREWRNRWINYYPLFEHTPIASSLKQIAKQTDGVEPWMAAGGQDAAPLQDGSILEILNRVREQLQQIENQYVVQKLSHTYR